jgi:hypothetical protein
MDFLLKRTIYYYPDIWFEKWEGYARCGQIPNNCVLSVLAAHDGDLIWIWHLSQKLGWLTSI